MGHNLLQRRIAARQLIVESGGRQFTLRRPTEYEMVKHAESSVLEFLAACIDDVALTESDLVEGGAPAPVPFDRALVFDWLQEKPDLWRPLSDALNAMLVTHREAMEGAEKN